MDFELKELRLMREILGYTQEKCAKDMKTSKQIIYNIETGKSTDAMTLAYTKYLLEHHRELHRNMLAINKLSHKIRNVFERKRLVKIYSKEEAE
jgi:DNA-binding XRE family transcriptional regulator